MTTIGKILVFLVFVAALCMGGLMIFISKTTPSWAEAVVDRDKKITVLTGMLDQEAEARKHLVGENKKMKNLLDNSVVDSNGTQGILKAESENLKQQLQALADYQAKSAQLAKETVAEKERLQKELEIMKNVLEDREKAVVKLLADLNGARTEMQAAKNDVVTATSRAMSLMERNKELERKFAEVQQKSQLPANTAGAAKDASYKNPPQVFVKGRIDRVDDVDRSLVKITIGSDSGIRKDQTLEVFRLSPKAEYLGRILIVDADLHHAVGRLLRQPGVQAPVLQPGDEVSSDLGMRNVK